MNLFILTIPNWSSKLAELTRPVRKSKTLIKILLSNKFLTGSIFKAGRDD
jgi:hypothetical protein